MNFLKKLPLFALALTVLAGTGLSAHANDAMMMKADDGMMKKDAMMADKMAMSQEEAFTPKAFAAAQASGHPLLVAFHKKGCPLCAAQKQALKEIYANPENKDLKVLVVDYDNDTESLKKFNVGMQGALILYKGNSEVSRSAGLTKATDIEKQIMG